MTKRQRFLEVVDHVGHKLQKSFQTILAIKSMESSIRWNKHQNSADKK